MLLTWYPDFCPAGTCQIEVEQDWTLKRFVRACPHHQGHRNTLGDNAAFAAVLQSSRVKEAARWAAKQQLMSEGRMDKEHPGVAYTKNADGSFTIQSGQTGAVRTRVQNAVTAAIADVAKPSGTSTVTVA